MANIVINAAVSKIYKDKASGVTTALRGKSIIGLMDVRPVVYKDKTRHVAGLKYDQGQRTFFLTTPTKADSVNIGVFISTYDVEVLQGKMLAKEELKDVYELPSVSAKFERGGYKDAQGGKLVEVFPKKVNLNILILTGKESITLRNSKGFILTCDFKNGKWMTLRPGTTLPMIYNMSETDKDLENLLKVDLPFPALDRNIYDNMKEMEERGDIDIEKHILENV